jgi:hypothetical protein
MGKCKTHAICSYMQATRNDAREYKESKCKMYYVMVIKCYDLDTTKCKMYYVMVKKCYDLDTTMT